MQSKRKKTLAELWQAFRRRFRTQDIFWETEKNSNVLAAYGMLGVMLLVLLAGVTISVEDLDYDQKSLVCLFIIYTAFLVPLPIYSICVKGNKRWLKYVLMLNSSIAMVSLNVFTSYPYVLLLVVPIILSTRYYSISFTRATAVVTGGLLMLSVWLCFRFNISIDYDLNYVEMPVGAVLKITESDTLLENVMAIGIDRAATLESMMRYAVSGKLFQLFIITTICVAVARRGHKMVLLQAAESVERASLMTELLLASEIQISALPDNFSEIKERTNVDLYATMDAAKEVGGDFYDFFAVDDDHVAIVIADVAGKGVPAALFMMTGKSLIRHCVQEKYSPAKAITAVNAQLCAENEANLFITAWLGVLEVSTGKLTYVNAGHCRPLLYRKESGHYQPLDVIHGIALACFDDTVYEQSEVQLGSGDAIFLYTDGATEATAPSDQMYGTDRLTAFLDCHKDSPPEELLPELRNSINAFVGDAVQFDDITMLMLRLPEQK